LRRELKTIEAMIKIYCRDHHGRGNICNECEVLCQYAASRLSNCYFGIYKPVCSRCTLHCYRQEMRGRVRQVMQYSGTRMIIVHPLLTIRHFIDAIG